MTPLKGKAPLPSSTSIIVPDPVEPKTCHEWKNALQRVKALYFRHQWKHCATRCKDLLLQPSISLHPLNVTFLNFYAALCNEAMARSMHNLSAYKLRLLEQSKQSYQEAASALPEGNNSNDEDMGSQKSSSSSSQESSGNSTPTPTRPNSPSCSSSLSSTDSTDEPLLGEHTLRYMEPTTPIGKLQQGDMSLLSPFSATSPASITLSQKRALKPSPLRIHKLVQADLSSSDDATESNLKIIEPSTPLAQITPADISALPTAPRSVTFSASSYIWLQNRALERYNAHLDAFANMLSRHVEVVDGLIDATREAQANRYAGKRITSCTGDEEDRKADVRARILRLKISGWERRAFDGERYQVLCERALSEL